MQTTIGMGEAAKLAGVSKSTLTRAVKAGRLSAKRTSSGAYRVDVAELERVYPLQAHQSATAQMTHHAPPSDTGSDASNARTYDAQIEGLNAQLVLMREQLDDAKEQRNRWQRQAEVAQRLVVDMRPQHRNWFGWVQSGRGE